MSHSNWFYDENNDFLPYDVESLVKPENRKKINASVFKFISDRKNEDEFRLHEDKVRKEVINEFLERTLRDITRHNESKTEEQWARVMDLDDFLDFQYPPFSDIKKINEWLNDVDNLQGKARVVYAILTKEYKFDCGIAEKYFPVRHTKRKRSVVIQSTSNQEKAEENENDGENENGDDDDDDDDDNGEGNEEGREEEEPGSVLIRFLYVDWSNAKPLPKTRTVTRNMKRKSKS